MMRPYAPILERRLEPIPKIDIFHAKQDWIVTWSQSQDGFASITIENHVQPLPLFGITANLMDAMGEDGIDRAARRGLLHAHPQLGRSARL